MKFRITVNFTNLIGAIGFLACIKLGAYDALWASVVMILGRAVIPEITELAKTIIQIKNKGAEQQ